MSKEKKTKGKKGFVRKWTILLVSVLVFALIVNFGMNYFSGYVDLYLGGGDLVITEIESSRSWDSQYYKSDYSDKKELQQAANELVEEIEGEGVVLMKNNGALPLAGKKLTLLGRDAVDPIYGGTGSGSVNLASVVNFRTGLENAGFTINDTVYKLLADFAARSPRGVIAMDNPSASTYYIGEMPVESYSAEAMSSFGAYSDAAVVMIGRPGGEGGDLTKDMKGWDDNYTEGQHQLELNKDEKDLIALAKESFDKVIVIINSSSAMELGELERDDGVDAVLWIGSPGQTGFNAVGDVLSGKITPSGKTADIYPSDFTRDPSFVNFGNYQYTNISDKNASGNAYFVQYEEGIYYGYRYYETAAAEGFIDYDTAVVYPFGYGMSYTDFTWEKLSESFDEETNTIYMDVKVTNSGDIYSGKDVVELYYTAPYTKGGIEKAEVVLGAFAKTGLLAPGESETLTLSIALEDMASYDYKNERAYVLDAGDYSLSLRTDSHNLKEGCEPYVYTLEEKLVYSGENHRSSDGTEVTNQFDDVSAMFTDVAAEGFATNMSRADFANTFPTAPVGKDLDANAAIIEGYQAYSAKKNLDPDAEMPATGEANGLSLIDLRGLDYDDEAWDMLLDQLSVKEMYNLLMNGAYTTQAVTSIGKPATTDFDGPSGINSYMTSVSATSYPSEVVIASTFNTELVERMGIMVGNEALENKVTGWYAPAMNIHRSQFGGRNFEYYSEDPLLSGAMGAACVSGSASKGVTCAIKHFAVNEQDENRNANGVSSWANEQALREIYLRPFELTVKNAAQTLRFISDAVGTVSEIEMRGCTEVMSSYNRIGSVWAGGSTALMQTVLRDEWGFEGFVISDFNLYSHMYPDQGIAAGTDLMLTYESMKSMEDQKSATAVSNMRKACHNILYTVVNSNAMNGIAPGTIITFTEAPWRGWLRIADCVLGGLLLLAAAYVAVRAGKKEKLEITGKE